MAELITQRADQLAKLSIFADCFPADLYGLALQLQPLRAEPGEVLMAQGDDADFFLIIGSGQVLVRHVDVDGDSSEVSLAAGQLIGEIALLRHSARMATVLAGTAVQAWRGDDAAFDELIELPGVLRIMVRTARQRLAEFVEPVPIKLRDGSEMWLRPALPGDSVRAGGGPIEFSAETIYRRFMSVRQPSPALMDYLFQVDYVNHFVWVVTDEHDDVVADARFIRDRAHPEEAEVAFIVADDYQGKGIGSFLMKALVLAAPVAGVRKFTARVLADNGPMRKILDGLGAVWVREDLGVVMTAVEVPDRADVHLPKHLKAQIAAMAAQVLQAVS